MGPFAEQGHDLIAVAQRIDKTGVERFLAKQRSALGEVAHVVLGDPARLRDPAHDLRKTRLHHAFERLAVRFGVRSVRVAVGRVLVLVALADPRLQADLVEGAAQEHRFVVQPGQADVARRLHVHLVERGRQVVAAVAGTELTERLCKSDRGFARLAELLDRVPDLLDLRHRHRLAADLGENADHTAVVGPALERVDDVAELKRTGEHDLGHRVVGDRFDHPAFEIEFEDHAAGHRRSAGNGKQRQRDHGENTQDGQHSDRGQDAHDDFLHRSSKNGFGSPGAKMVSQRKGCHPVPPRLLRFSSTPVFESPSPAGPGGATMPGMCTMSWLRNEAGYDLFFNRDEKRSRLPAEPPAIRRVGSTTVLAPASRR